MKKRTRILTMMLAVFMLASVLLPLTAFAAGGSGNGGAGISVNCPEGLSIDGMTFEAYKVYDLTTSGDEPNINYSYTINPAFQYFSEYPTSATQSLLEYLDGLDPVADKHAVQTVARELWKFIDGAGVSPTASGTAGEGATSVTLTKDGTSGGSANLDFGYYLIYNISDPPFSGIGDVVDEDYDGVVSFITMGTFTGNTPITPKAEGPQVEKKVFNGDIPDDWTDANIGDVVDFQITSKVPASAHLYDVYEFIVHDIMSGGLSFIPES
ncbi:MAG: isopeptide-forming domain-containing fimbrial protein, partial [Oscillospiraceae bacterium]|nr:isopeptide-forming domain-containing fimbrial protein [Oscillospiraceae bacterium]